MKCGMGMHRKAMKRPARASKIIFAFLCFTSVFIELKSVFEAAICDLKSFVLAKL